MHPKRILFICSANTDRSPTFHNWFAQHTDYEVKSCGINGSSYDSLISPDLLGWADEVYVMDLGHYMHIDKNYHCYLHKVQIIGCSDQYSFEDNELIAIVEYWAKMKGFEILDYVKDVRPCDSYSAKYSYDTYDKDVVQSFSNGEQDDIVGEDKYYDGDDICKAIVYLGKLFDDHLMDQGSKVIEQRVKEILKIE